MFIYLPNPMAEFPRHPGTKVRGREQFNPGTKVHPPRYQSPDTPVPGTDEATKKRPLKRPKKRNTAKRISTSVDECLFSWITFWNSLKDKGLVSVGASEVPSEGVVKGWKRVQASKVLQELLADKDAIERKIREQSFLQGGWFTLPKLFGGKNGDGEFIVRKILASGYKSNGKPTANVGAGVNFDPNKDYSNAKF